MFCYFLPTIFSIFLEKKKKEPSTNTKSQKNISNNCFKMQRPIIFGKEMNMAAIIVSVIPYSDCPTTFLTGENQAISDAVLINTLVSCQPSNVA